MRPKTSMIMIAATMVAIASTGCSHNNQGNMSTQKAKEKLARAKDTRTEVNDTTSRHNNNKVNYLRTAAFKKKVMDFEKHPTEWKFEGDRPAIIDFYATWCRPCRMMAPVMEQLARSYKGKIDFYKVDIDKEQELAALMGIESIPTFLFIPVNGKPTVQMGAMEKDELEEIIKSTLVIGEQGPQVGN